MDSTRDILARRNGLSDVSQTDHQTDPPSAPPSDSLTDSVGEGRSEGLTSEGLINPGWISPCRYCGTVESAHQCPIAWKWDVAVPDEPAELVLYLRTVWGIRWAELIGMECSGAAVRTALAIIGEGKADGTVYKDPAGLIVKIARRAQSALNRVAKARR